MQLKTMLSKDNFKKEKRSFAYPGSKKAERKNCYVFTSLAGCRKDFERFINSEMDWPGE